MDIRDADVRAFEDLVAHGLGLSLRGTAAADVGSVLRRRVAARGGDCARYLRELAGGGWAGEEAALAADLTVAETYFFRTAEQFRALAEAAVPRRMAARSATRRLRLLSAGCASGEEPYSIAMTLRDAVPDG